MPTPELSRSAKLYQEMRQPTHRETRRRPGPHITLSENEVHKMELLPPFPDVDVLHHENNKPPTAGGTKPWPWGFTEEEIT